MEKEYTLTIKGFTSAKQLKAFYDWYEGQGEQDASMWFENMKDDGKLDVDTMNTDMKKKPVKSENGLTFWVKPL